MAFTDVQLKIELPAPETPPSESETKHTLSVTNDGTDDEEGGLKRINYPSIDAGSSTVHHMMRQYGLELSVDSSATESDDEHNTISNISNISNIDRDATTTTGHTIDTSTVIGLSSFPDLSYNDFDAIRGTSESTRISTQSIVRLNATKFTTRGHANGMFKRRSHSAVLSVSDTSSLRRQNTNISKTFDDEPPPFHYHAITSRVPIDRGRTYTNTNTKLLQPTPRRLSLSLSSMTSETSYSRYDTNISNISRIAPFTSTKLKKIKIRNDEDHHHLLNTSMNTVLINHNHSNPQQLTPLMDGFEAYSRSTDTDIGTSSSDGYNYDDDYDDDSDDDDDDDDDDDGFNKLELEESLNEFFSVIDSANIGSVTFDILKICLKLLGVDLSAMQLDLLLNGLTQYKPSLPISRQMMNHFLFYNTENADIIRIRTEIMVGLLSNHVQTTFANKKYNKAQTQTRKRSLKSKKSKSKSKSQCKSSKMHKSKSKKSKTKSRRSRFHSDGNIMKTEAKTATPNPHRKPPQIHRHGTGAHTGAQSEKKIPELSPNSLANLPPLPPTPLKQKKYSLPPAANMHSTDYHEWLLLCFRNSIVDSLMELVINDDLRVYVFDEEMISHHMSSDDVLSAIEYLFECQFAFMSNGCAYLDFNGFAAGMKKCNIHFENPQIAIPLIFEQLIVINDKMKYKHPFIAEDTFVVWMLDYIRIHMNHHNEFDQRINVLFSILHSFNHQFEYNQKRKSKPKSKVNPFESTSLYSPSTLPSQQRLIANLNIPPRQRFNEFHSYSNARNTHSKYQHCNVQQSQSIHSQHKHRSKYKYKYNNNNAFYTEY